MRFRQSQKRRRGRPIGGGKNKKVPLAEVRLNILRLLQQGHSTEAAARAVEKSYGLGNVRRAIEAWRKTAFTDSQSLSLQPTAK
ncbi:MAG TPA: hypothetical protein VKR59_04650 [Terriglobales bacterium]|nr:hypothetical protein [Terriglobales bacterium]